MFIALIFTGCVDATEEIIALEDTESEALFEFYEDISQWENDVRSEILDDIELFNRIVYSSEESIKYILDFIVPEEVTEEEIKVFAYQYTESLVAAEKNPIHSLNIRFYDDPVFVGRELPVANIVWAPNGKLSDNADVFDTHGGYKYCIHSFRELQGELNLTQKEKEIYGVVLAAIEDETNITLSNEAIFETTANEYNISKEDVEGVVSRAADRRVETYTKNVVANAN